VTSAGARVGDPVCAGPRASLVGRHAALVSGVAEGVLGVRAMQLLCQVVRTAAAGVGQLFLRVLDGYPDRRVDRPGGPAESAMHAEVQAQQAMVGRDGDAPR
jgi:hypothetical protein